jgi:ABC-type nickel/cobalt efflux system permease component RcnA
VRKLVVAAGLLAALAAPALASAHPLGNFTINRFTRLEVSGHRIYARYVLDLAEIPTYQAQQRGVDAGDYARTIAAHLQLTVAGRPVAFRPVRHALAFPRGAGGLHTMRLEVVLEGPNLRGAAEVRLRDENYAGRLGWKEIVVGEKTPSRSDELRAYPKDLLSSPLDTTSVARRLLPVTGPERAPALTSGKALQAPDRVADSGFSRLIGQRHLGPLVILASLFVALFWGAAHALTPGHGKTIVTAYLVGQRGTPAHAALLGLIVTVTHTVGVFGLGLVTLLLSQFIVPETLYPWLALVSGLSVIGVGIAVLQGRLREVLRARAHARAHAHDHHHSHDHDHGHDHGHGHSHAPEPGTGVRGLVAVGISGGILPCPSALVVLLAAIALHRVAFGLVLILAFSAGLALAITGIGLIAVLAKRAFARASFDGLMIRSLPAVSALVILVVGIVMTAHAVPGVR